MRKNSNTEEEIITPGQIVAFCKRSANLISDSVSTKQLKKEDKKDLKKLKNNMSNQSEERSYYSLGDRNYGWMEM